MKNQDLFSSKDKTKKLKCRLLRFLFGALRVNQKFFFNLSPLEMLSKMIYCYVQHQRSK